MFSTELEFGELMRLHDAAAQDVCTGYPSPYGEKSELDMKRNLRGVVAGVYLSPAVDLL